MTPEEKDCYNRILAIFLDYSEENREDFLEVLEHYESNSFFKGIGLSPRVSALNGQLNFSNDVRIKALKQLVEIFDIKRIPKETSFISGFGGIYKNP